jgi:hypothetical protein
MGSHANFVQAELEPSSFYLHHLSSWDHRHKALCQAFYLFIYLFIYLFEKGSCYVVQADLELEILLPQLPQCWDVSHHTRLR